MVASKQEPKIDSPKIISNQSTPLQKTYPQMKIVREGERKELWKNTNKTIKMADFLLINNYQ